MEDIATEEDIMWMRHALTLADKAESIGEVPVGACVVLNGELIGEGFNTPITDNDPSAHAELRAVKEAAAAVQNYRLIDTTLYYVVCDIRALLYVRRYAGTCTGKAGGVWRKGCEDRRCGLGHELIATSCA